MNNTDKLLRAFIEASGFEIDIILGKEEVDGGLIKSRLTIDYKVTKKNDEAIKLLKGVIENEDNDDAIRFLGSYLFNDIKRLIN